MISAQNSWYWSRSVFCNGSNKTHRKTIPAQDFFFSRASTPLRAARTKTPVPASQGCAPCEGKFRPAATLATKPLRKGNLNLPPSYRTSYPTASRRPPPALHTQRLLRHATTPAPAPIHKTHMRTYPEVKTELFAMRGLPLGDLDGGHDNAGEFEDELADAEGCADGGERLEGGGRFVGHGWERAWLVGESGWRKEAGGWSEGGL